MSPSGQLIGKRATPLFNKGKGLVFLLVILIIGLFLRLYRLDAVPAGLSTDEAAAGVNAESVLDGNFQLFYPPFDEPVFVYTSAAGVALFGPTLLGLHVAAAAFGILALVMTFLLGREMFGTNVGLLGAGGLALSYWAVQTSRLGFRAIALPALELLAFYFLWRALKGKKLPDFALGGFFLALAIYTYPASRVLPLIVTGFILVALVVRRWGLISYRGLLVYTAAFLMTLAPFGLYFWQHPESFTGRFQEAASVAPGTTVASPGLGDSLTRTLGMFAVAGDPQWKYNLSGQPVFDPVWFLLFAAGIIMAFRLSTKPEFLFLLLWFALGLLPGILTGEAPHNLRTIVSQPAVYFFPALSLGALISWLSTRGWQVSSLAYLAIVALFVVTAGRTFRDYFDVWANDPHVSEVFYPDVAQAIGFLKAFSPHEQVFMSARAPDLISPMRNYFVWRQPMPLPQLFDAGQGVVLSSSKARTIYLLPMSAPADVRVESLLKRGTLLREDRTSQGQVLYRAYALENAQLPRPGTSIDGRFGDLAELTSVDVQGTTQSGEPLTVTLYTKPISRASQEGEYKFFVHLVDSTGYIWSQAEGVGGDPAQWTSDELVLTLLTLPIPSDAPPKDYTLEIGLYSLQRGRLPVLDSAGQVIGTAIRTDPFRLVPGQASALDQNQASHQLNDLMVGDQVVLAGFDADETADPGGTLRLTLYWKKVGNSVHDDLLQTSLVNASGQIVPLTPSELVDKLYPPTAWQNGRIIRNSYLINLPVQLLAGEYKVNVSFVDRSTGESIGPGLTFATVQVSNIAHRFTLPPIRNPLSVSVGDSIEFIGYDLPPAVTAGDSLNLTLYWRDKQSMATAYTVFVHLIDKQNRLLAQRDRPPVNGARPTTSWVPGEIIVDRFRIPLPVDLAPGQYALEIGMYDPATLTRLPLFGPTGERMEGDRFLIGNMTVDK